MSTATTALINGQAVDYVPISDRGLAYGDGIFETIAIADGKPCLWQKHLHRLLNGCKSLGIEFNSVAELTDEVFQLSLTTKPPAVIKIIITRGSSSAGYKIDPHTKPLRIVQLQERQSFSASLYRQGITACFCKQRLGHNPALSKIKHLCRLEQVLARLEWQDEYHEGIMFDYDDNAIEGTMSNLFIVNGETLKTPRLDHCGVRGVMRDWILEQCTGCGITAAEADIDRQAIVEADGLFFCNALIRIWPVHRIGARRYDVTRVHQLTRQFTSSELGITL